MASSTLRLLLGCLLLPFSFAAALQAADISVVPRSPSAGSAVLIDVGGVVPNAMVEVELTGGAGGIALGSAAADRTGAALLQVTLPSVPSGSYTLRALVGRSLVASAPVTLQAGLAISLVPNAASPGTRIAFEVSGLASGLIEVKFGGVRVFGPAPTEGGSFSGEFVLPNPRSLNPSVEVFNFSGARQAASATATFTVLPGEGNRTRAEIISLNVPPTMPRLGETVQVTGRMALPSHVLAAQDTRLSIVAEVCGDGSVVPAPPGKSISCAKIPVNRSPVTLDDEGNFSADIAPLSMFQGDAVPPSSTGGADSESPLGLVYVTPKQSSNSPPPAPNTSFVPQGQPFPTDTFTIRVRGANMVGFDTPPPIEGAVVAVDSGLPLLKPPKLGTGGGLVQQLATLADEGCGRTTCPGDDYSGPATLFSTPNQFKDWQEKLRNVTITPAFSCPFRLDRGITNAQGSWQFTVDAAKAAQATMVGINSAGSVSPLLGANPPAVPNRFAAFEVKISAFSPISPSGFVFGAPNNEGLTSAVYFRFFFDHKTRRYWLGLPSAELLEDFENGVPDEAEYTEIFPNVPLVVDLAPQPTGFDFQFVDPPFVPGLNRALFALPDDASGSTVPWYRTLYRFSDSQRSGGLPNCAGPDSLGCVYVDPANRAKVLLNHDEALFGVLEEVELFFGNAQRRAIRLDSPAAGTCSVEGAVQYEVELPDAHRLDPGVHVGTVRGKLQFSDRDFVGRFLLEVREGPNWIYNTNLERRKVNWSPAYISLNAEEPPTDSMVNMPAQSDVDLPPQNNDSMGIALLGMEIDQGGFSKLTRVAVQSATGLNAEANPPEPVVTQINVSANGNVQGTAGAPAAKLSVGTDEEITIFDSGKIPLFRYVWGIPPIADATIGADFWFRILYKYFGDIGIAASGAVTQDIAFLTRAIAGLDLWLDASILFDIVDLGVKARAQVEAQLEVTVDTEDNLANNRPPLSAFEDTFFKFRLLADWWASVGPCPACIGDDGTVELVDQCISGPCSDTKGQDERAIRPDTAGRTAVASNGRGRALAAWAGADGTLNFELSSAGSRDSLLTMPAAEMRGLVGMDVAWLTRDRAVAVWAQSGLSQAAFDALKVEFDERQIVEDYGEVSSQQRIRYRVFENGAWGPVQNLTNPGFGDGGVQLAACLGENRRNGAVSPCPVGGEALLVFTRDLDGQLQGNQRVFYSRFSGSAWTVPVRLDPASTAKEVQPAAAYVDGEPVAVWIRNPTRSLADTAQRELAYRFIDLAPAGTVATALSKGLASPSVAGDSLGRVVVAYTAAQDPGAFVSNRQGLTLAEADCTGGLCTWAETALLEGGDRRIWAERPVLQISPSDQALILIRHLGYAALDNTPALRSGDSIGAITGTGDAAMVTVNRSTGDVVLDLLSNDGGLHWKQDFAFDASLGESIVTTSALLDPPAKRLRDPGLRVRGTTRRPDGGNGPVMSRLGRLPDLAVLSIESDSGPQDLLENLVVRIRVANRGAPFTGQFNLVSAWDGPVDSGRHVWTESMSDPGPEGSTLTLFVGYPEGAISDEMHRLYVVADPDGAIADADGENNQGSLLFGEVPTPRISGAATSAQANGALLEWDASTDPRVIGYRIFRAYADGEFFPAGSSFVAGWYDPNVDTRLPVRYRVSAFTRSGIESDWSEPLSLNAQPRQSPDPNVVFRSTFD